MIRKPWSSINQQASFTRGLLGTLLCLQNTHVSVFPYNTIIAWDANIHHKYKDIIITTFIIASWAYLQQSPTCTRVNNLDYMVIYLTPMAFWCWSCFALGRGLVNGSATFRSVCTLQIFMSPSRTYSRIAWKHSLMCFSLLCDLGSCALAMAPVLPQ